VGAKDLIIRPVSPKIANEFIKRTHYSKKVAATSLLHMGVYWHGKLEGAIQLGRPIAKRAMLGLVSSTRWNGMLELNRLAFTDRLPRNSESRAISVAFKVLKKHRPDIEWVVSFADGCQCGDGAIYRASGFVLTDIRTNKGLIRLPSGEVVHQMAYAGGHYSRRRKEMLRAGYCKWKDYLNATQEGWKYIPGFQLRYIYFLDPTARERLTVPILPFSEIQRRGAGMYLGEKRAGSDTGDTSSLQDGKGGSIPTSALTKTSHA